MSSDEIAGNNTGNSKSTLVRAARGVVWVAVAKFGRQGILLCIYYLLIRRLGPSDFGYFREALIFLALADILLQFGLPVALIQKKTLSRIDTSTAFWGVLGLGIVVCLVMVSAARPIASLYSGSGEPQDISILISIIPWLSLTAVLAALRTIPLTLLKKNLDFRKILIPDVASALIGGSCAVVFARQGLGIWSLVWGYLIGEFAQTLLTFWASQFRPTLKFSRATMWGLLGIGLPILGSQIVDQVSRTLDDFLVGSRLGEKELGLYMAVFFLVTIPQVGVGGLFAQVGLSAFARVQDSNLKLREGFLLMTRVVFFVSAPFLVVLSVGAPVLGKIVGADWEGIELPLTIMAIMGLFNVAAGNPGVLWIVKGKADIRFFWFCFMLVSILTATWIGLHWGLIGVCTAMTIRSIVLFPLPAFITRRMVGLEVRKYLFALVPYFSASVIMWSALWPLVRWESLLGVANPFPSFSPYLQAVILLTVGVVGYVGVVRLLKPDSWKEAFRLGKMVVNGSYTGDLFDGQ